MTTVLFKKKDRRGRLKMSQLDLNGIRKELIARYPQAFVMDMTQAFSSLFRDFALWYALWSVRHSFDSCPTLLWYVMYLAWVAATGFVMWCVFVLGHDCSHRVFSPNVWLNDAVGLCCHAPLLVPFYPWAKSHRLHHQHTNDVEKDHSWRPIGRRWFHKLNKFTKMMRFSNMLLLSWPFYLVDESPLGSGNHFNPWSRLFQTRKERVECIISNMAIVAFLYCLWIQARGNILEMILYYGAPWVIFSMWLTGVTYLHHTSPHVTYYRKDAWNFVEGALGTVDRSYGKWIEPLHHWIGSGHVVHHLFYSRIPHYRLERATAIIKKLVSDRYHEDKRPIWVSFAESRDKCHVVHDTDKVVRYERVTSF